MLFLDAFCGVKAGMPPSELSPLASSISTASVRTFSDLPEIRRAAYKELCRLGMCRSAPRCPLKSFIQEDRLVHYVLRENPVSRELVVGGIWILI